MEILSKAIELVLKDHLIDTLIVQVPVDFLVGLVSKKIFDNTIDIIVNFRKAQTKPIIVVSPHGSVVEQRLEFERRLSDARIAVYPTFERAAKAIKNVSWYYRFNRLQSS